METNACYRDVENRRYCNVKSHLFSPIILKNMLLHKYMSCIFLSLHFVVTAQPKHKEYSWLVSGFST